MELFPQTKRETVPGADSMFSITRWITATSIAMGVSKDVSNVFKERTQEIGISVPLQRAERSQVIYLFLGLF